MFYAIVLFLESFKAVVVENSASLTQSKKSHGYEIMLKISLWYNLSDYMWFPDNNLYDIPVISFYHLMISRGNRAIKLGWKLLKSTENSLSNHDL